MTRQHGGSLNRLTVQPTSRIASAADVPEGPPPAASAAEGTPPVPASEGAAEGDLTQQVHDLRDGMQAIRDVLYGPTAGRLLPSRTGKGLVADLTAALEKGANAVQQIVDGSRKLAAILNPTLRRDDIFDWAVREIEGQQSWNGKMQIDLDRAREAMRTETLRLRYQVHVAYQEAVRLRREAGITEPFILPYGPTPEEPANG